MERDFLCGQIFWWSLNEDLNIFKVDNYLVGLLCIKTGQRSETPSSSFPLACPSFFHPSHVWAAIIVVKRPSAIEEGYHLSYLSLSVLKKDGNRSDMKIPRPKVKAFSTEPTRQTERRREWPKFEKETWLVSPFFLFFFLFLTFNFGGGCIARCPKSFATWLNFLSHAWQENQAFFLLLWTFEWRLKQKSVENFLSHCVHFLYFTLGCFFCFMFSQSSFHVREKFSSFFHPLRQTFVPMVVPSFA